jgi:hypothetical protein
MMGKWKESCAPIWRAIGAARQSEGLVDYSRQVSRSKPFFAAWVSTYRVSQIPGQVTNMSAGLVSIEPAIGKATLVYPLFESFVRMCHALTIETRDAVPCVAEIIQHWRLRMRGRDARRLRQTINRFVCWPRDRRRKGMYHSGFPEPLFGLFPEALDQ